MTVEGRQRNDQIGQRRARQTDNLSVSEIKRLVAISCCWKYSANILCYVLKLLRDI